MPDLRPLKRLDWPLFAAVLALCLYGLVMIYSATRAAETTGLGAPSEFVLKQALWLLFALLAFALTLLLDYEKIVRWHVLPYCAILLLLLVVLKIGRGPNGAARWLALGGLSLQVSELAKIAVILSISGFLSRRIQAVAQLRVVLASLLIPAAPVFLVLIQPNLGTALVIIAIWFGALYLVGARARHLGAAFACGLVLFCLLWNLDRLPLDNMRPAPLGKMLAHVALKDYQKRRIAVFLHPQSDPLGAGYHVIQSRVAVGSGQLWGRGLFQGTQSRLRFTPERHTDFIFSVVGEELGLLGALAMLLLYLFLFWRGLRVALHARDPLGSLLAAGAVSMLIFHALINIGMSINILPITGLPLPFVSYGGSNLLASFLAFGLLQNVHIRQESLIF